MRAFGISKVLSFYAAMIAVAGAAMAWHGGLARLLPAMSLAAWSVSGALGIGAGLAMVVASRALTNYFSWASRLEDELRALFGELSRGQALLVAALGGLAEEALFRGVLQQALGIIIGALVFGMLHIGPNHRFLPWTIMACVAGLVFGGLFAYTGDLVAPVLAHVTVNFLNMRHLAREERGTLVDVGPVGGEGVVSS